MSEISKNQIKLVKSLHLKKFRLENGLFVCEGRKVVEELIGSSVELVELFCTNDHASFYPQAKVVSNAEIIRMSNFKTSPGILAVGKIPHQADHKFTFSNALLLDNLNDPGNLGTIVRSAAWFGVQEIFLLGETVDRWNPKVIQASMGAIFNINLHQANSDFPEIAREKGYSLIGADMEGIPLRDFEWPKKPILIIGSESHGISKPLKTLLHSNVSIPRIGSGESLNAAVAASIILNYMSQ